MKTPQKKINELNRAGKLSVTSVGSGGGGGGGCSVLLLLQEKRFIRVGSQHSLILVLSSGCIQAFFF